MRGLPGEREKRDAEAEDDRAGALRADDAAAPHFSGTERRGTRSSVYDIVLRKTNTRDA